MLVFDGFDQAEELAGKLQNGLQQLQQQLAQGGLPNLGGGLPSGVGGLLGYLPWVGLAWVAYLVLRRGAGPTLALADFELDPAAKVRDGVVVRISGRSRGPIAKLFSALNLDPVTTWTATKEAVHCESSSLFGRSTTILPMRQVSVIRTEHGVPKTTLLVGAVVLLMGLANFGSLMGKVACLAGVGLGISGVFNRRFVLAVESGASGQVGIAVQPSMLGGPSFDLDKLQEAARQLQKLVRSAERHQDDREERDPSTFAPAIPLAAPRPVEAQPAPPQVVEPAPAAARFETETPGAYSPPPATPAGTHSIFEPAQPPKPRPARPRSKRSVRISKTRLTTPVAADEEALATEAFNAAVRVFESKRPSEAEAAWWALIRRWPNTNAARRARRVLENRRKRERERKGH